MARKIKRKELKEPDKFQSFFRKIIKYISENRNKLLLFSGIFVLVILSSWGWYFYRSNYEENAWKKYSSILGSYHKDNNSETYLNAIARYEELVKKYPNSNAAVNARYSVGNIYFKLGEIDKSTNAYRKFIEKSPEANDLATLAHIGLGYCYEAKGDFANALESLNNSLKFSIGSSFEGIVYRNMARIYEEMDKPKKALECYKKALNQITDPRMEVLIKRKISTLS